MPKPALCSSTVNWHICFDPEYCSTADYKPEYLSIAWPGQDICSLDSAGRPGLEFKQSELVILLRVLDSTQRAKQSRQLCFFFKRLCEIASYNYNNYTQCLSANARTCHLLGTGAMQFNINSVS